MIAEIEKPNRVSFRQAGLSTAIAAIVLLRTYERVTVVVPSSIFSAPDMEGETLAFGRQDNPIDKALHDLVVQEWPGFLVWKDGAFCTVEQPVALIDAQQCLIALMDHDRLIVRSTVTDGIVLPQIGLVREPSLIVEGLQQGGLDLPVLYEPSGHSTDFNQYLPIGTGRTMVRSRPVTMGSVSEPDSNPDKLVRILAALVREAAEGDAG